ncbi:p28-like protein [Fowlpox virus]|nr:p28-like protein [Fowlpox virus]
MDVITCYNYRDFNFVKYNEVSLIIMKSNNYINASRLCESQNRDFRNWKRLMASKFLIRDVKEINKHLKIPNNKMIIEVADTNSKNCITSGFYVHQDLIYPIAYWISPIFAVKVNKIINYYLYNEYEIMIKDTRTLYNEIQVDMSLVTEIASNLANEYYQTLTGVIEKLDKFNKDYVTPSNTNNKSNNNTSLQSEKNTLEFEVDRLVFFI